jgi:hypothetical protein
LQLTQKKRKNEQKKPMNEGIKKMQLIPFAADPEPVKS